MNRNKTHHILIGLIFCFLPLSAQLKINEYAQANGTFTDENGDWESWVEIKNSATKKRDLSAFYLSDDATNLKKWRFAPKVINPQTMVVVFLSGKNRTSPNFHTGFKVEPGGETLLISDGIRIIDQLKIPEYCPSGYSFSRKNTDFVFTPNPTPGKENNTSVFFSTKSPDVKISPQYGFYSPNVTVSLAMAEPANGTIRYTLDGSEPNENSLIYIKPFVLSQGTGNDSRLSSIPTNPGFNFPKGPYTVDKADTRGWLPPFGSPFKTPVVRARIFETNKLPGRVTTATYLIDAAKTKRYQLPVLCISCDMNGFFSDETGIYVFGNSEVGNYEMEGRTWERPVNLQLYDTTGLLLFNTDAGVRINGGGGRHAPQKSLKVYFRSTYGNDKLQSNVLGKSTNQFQHLLIRNGGHRPDCFPRDHIGSLIVENTGSDAGRSLPVVVLLNGEYWGIQFLKDRLDDEALLTKYNMDESELSMLELSGKVYRGSSIDSVDYNQMVSKISTEPQNSDEYKNAMNKIDLVNYSTFIAAETFLYNGDWPNNNTRFWRKTSTTISNPPAGHDGKWRWLIYDLDAIFGGDCDRIRITPNGLLRATDTTVLYNRYTQLFRALLKSDTFKTVFVNRYCDLLNTSFSSNVLQAKVKTVKATLAGSVSEHINRWRYPSTAVTLTERAKLPPSTEQYDNMMANVLTFAKQRTDYVREHLVSFFNLKGFSQLTVNVNDTSMGYIRVNSLDINHKTEGTTTAVYPWNGLYANNFNITVAAVSKPGYRFVRWDEDGSTKSTRTLKINSNTQMSAVFMVDPSYVSPQSLVINEICASNKRCVFDDKNTSSDWIELYNPTPSDINIGGLYLTNNFKFPAWHKIADGSTIKSHEYKIFWADNHPEAGPNHLNFKLSGGNGMVELTNCDGYTIIDSVKYSNLGTDYSFGRTIDAGSDWKIFNVPTPFYTNNNIARDTLNTLPFYGFPNPVNSGWLYLNKRVDGTIFDFTGRPVITISNSSEIATGILPRGVYFLRNSDGQSITFVISE